MPNKATGEVRAFCQRLLADLEYRAEFEQRWRSGTLAPALEQMVWAYVREDALAVAARVVQGGAEVPARAAAAFSAWS